MESHPRQSERGVALLLTLLVFLILAAVVFELSTSSSVDYLVAKNDADVKKMDTSIQAALYEAFDTLRQDFESDSASGGGAGMGSPDPGAGGEESSGPSDSFEDEWGRPIEKTYGDIRVSVLIEDENSKFNILALLAEDEDFAAESKERLIRIIDYYREDFDRDLDSPTAETMVINLISYMKGLERREDIPLPLLESHMPEDKTLPLSSIDELLLVEGFTEDILYDQREPDVEELIPGLASMITVWTSLDTLDPSASNDSGSSSPGSNPGTGNQAPSGNQGAAGANQGPVGTLININTAPRAVLYALLDRSKMPREIVEALIRYRNYERVEEGEDPMEDDPLGGYELGDLYGEDVVPREFYESLQELDEVPDFLNFTDAQAKNEFLSLLTVQSDLFSIHLTARLVGGTAAAESVDGPEEDPEDGGQVVRRVRSLVWRRQGNDGVEILPLIFWEVRHDRKYRIPDFLPDEMPIR